MVIKLYCKYSVIVKMCQLFWLQYISKLNIINFVKSIVYLSYNRKKSKLGFSNILLIILLN